MPSCSQRWPVLTLACLAPSTLCGLACASQRSRRKRAGASSPCSCLHGLSPAPGRSSDSPGRRPLPCLGPIPPLVLCDRPPFLLKDFASLGHPPWVPTMTQELASATARPAAAWFLCSLHSRTFQGHLCSQAQPPHAPLHLSPAPLPICSPLHAPGNSSSPCPAARRLRTEEADSPLLK